MPELDVVGLTGLVVVVLELEPQPCGLVVVVELELEPHPCGLVVVVELELELEPQP